MSSLKAPENFTITRLGDKPLLVNSLSDVKYEVVYKDWDRTIPSGAQYGLAVTGEKDVPTDGTDTPSVPQSFAPAKAGSKATFDISGNDIARDDGVAEYQGNGQMLYGIVGAVVNGSYSVPKTAGFIKGQKYRRYVLDRYFHSICFQNGKAAYSSGTIVKGDVYYVPEGSDGSRGNTGTGGNITGLPDSVTQPPSQTFAEKNSGIETNLRLLSKSFGQPRGRYGVKWRSGLIHTFEGNPAYESFSHMYGFRFLYNPSSWTQNTQMTYDVDIQNVMASKPLNLPLLGNYAGIGLTVFVNRVLEMSMTEEQLLKENWSTESRIANVAPSDPTWYDPSPVYDAKDGWSRAASAATFEQKVKALKKYGTLSDLEFLFKSVNGDGKESYHRKYLGAGSKTPLALDGRGNSTRTADYGFLNAIPVRVWLGPDITFVGRITSVDISHIMFTENMVPKYSQLSLQITRPLTWGTDVADSYSITSAVTSSDATKNGVLASDAGGANSSTGSGATTT